MWKGEELKALWILGIKWKEKIPSGVKNTTKLFKSHYEESILGIRMVNLPIMNVVHATDDKAIVHYRPMNCTKFMINDSTDYEIIGK